jgi:hypothetical protein
MDAAAPILGMDSIFGPAVAMSTQASILDPLASGAQNQSVPLIENDWWGAGRSSLPLQDPPIGLGGGSTGDINWQSQWFGVMPDPVEHRCWSCGCNPTVAAQFGKLEEQLRSMEALMLEIASSSIPKALAYQ